MTEQPPAHEDYEWEPRKRITISRSQAIDILDCLLNASGPEADHAHAQHKLRFLFEYYGISPGAEDRWKQLALALAIGLVNLPQSPKPLRGRPVGSTKQSGIELSYEIEKLMYKEGLSPYRACFLLAQSRALETRKTEARQLFGRYERYLSKHFDTTPGRRAMELRKKHQ
jgi:hypothetical protein